MDFIVTSHPSIPVPHSSRLSLSLEGRGRSQAGSMFGFGGGLGGGSTAAAAAAAAAAAPAPAPVPGAHNGFGSGPSSNGQAQSPSLGGGFGLGLGGAGGFGKAASASGGGIKGGLADRGGRRPATNQGVAVDFDSLLAESDRLTAHISSPEGIPALKKSLPEIELGAKSIASQATASAAGDALELSPQAAAQRAEQRGMRLLAQCNFDAELHRRRVVSLQLQPSYEPRQAFGETDIEGYLDHHHDMVVVTAVEEAKRAAEETALLHQRQWEWEDWSRSKKAMMEGMGQRSGHWEARDLDTQRERELAVEDADAQAFKLRIGGTLSQISPALALGGGLTGSQMASSSQSSQLTPEMRQYADLVRGLNEQELGLELSSSAGGNNNMSVSSSPVQVMSEMASVVQGLVPEGAVAGPAVMHARVWWLLHHIVEGGESSSLDGPAYQQQQRYVRSTLDHLQSQFRDMMRRKVAGAAARGQLSSPPGLSATPGLRADVKAYVELLRKASQFGGLTLDGEPLWPQIYFCLRCGGLQQAAELAVAAGSADEVLSGVVTWLKSRTEGAACPPGVESDLLQGYQRCAGSDEGDDPYKQLVLNLLLCAEPGKTQQAMKTIEDYIWFKLWFCVSEGRLGMKTAALSQYSLADLQREVTQTFGVDHFDRDGRTPFLYTSVLFMCQLFAEGVEHLRRSGLLVAAVHLGIALSYSGVLPMLRDPMARASQSDEDGSSGSDCVQDLVIMYAQRLQASDPQVAAEYLMRIKAAAKGSSVTFDGVMQRLLLDSRQYGVLAGEIGADGRRKLCGSLDRYLSEAEVRRILEGAAAMARSQGMAKDAVTLYGLAGQYVEVLRVLNRQLSAVLVPPHPAREDLKAIAIEFFEKHLSRGQTYVQEQLVAGAGHDGGQVGSTFHTLLNLTVFFDHWEAGRWREALGVLEGLKLLPSGENQVMPCAEGFNQLPEEVRNNFHDILLKAMDCMYHLHMDVKRRWGAAASAAKGSQEATELQLMELRQRANALVTFASVLKGALPSDTSSRLARMEVVMM
jgi:nuclear pore complex protein Nup93